MPTIQYELKAESSDFESKMKGAISTMKGGANAAGLLASGVLAAGAAIGGLAGQLEAVVDEVNTLASSSGLSTSSVNALRLAAESSGKALTDLVPKDLALRIQKAADGSAKAVKGFQELGVSVTDSNGNLRDANKVYEETLAAILAIEDPTTRAAKANQALGDAGAQALSAFGSLEDFQKFKDLGEEFGFRTGPEAVAALGDFQVAQGQLTLAMETAAQTALDLVGGVGFIADKIKAFSLGFVFATEAAAEWARQTIDFVSDVGAVMLALATGDAKALKAAVDGFEGPFERFGNVAEAATEKARDFWTLNQGEAPAAAEAVTEVEVSMKRTERAIKDAEKAAKSQATAMNALAGIAKKAGDDQLTAQDKVEQSYLDTVAAIDKQEAALIELSKTGELTATELSAIETARAEASARKERELSDLRQMELDKRIAQEEAFQAKILEIEESSAQLLIDLEDATTEARREKRETLTQATLMGLDTIAQTTQIVADLIIGKLEEEGESQRERLENQMAVNEAIRDEGGQITATQRKRTKALRRQLKETNKQIKRAFAARQAAAVGGIAIDAAQSILALTPFFAFLGPGAPAAAAAVVTPVALANTAAVLSEKAPKVHDGTAAVDEVLATLRRGESVLNQRGSESIGRDAVERANRGIAAQGPPMTQIVFRQRVLDTMMADTITQGGRTQNLITEDRPPPGTLDPYGGQ